MHQFSQPWLTVAALIGLLVTTTSAAQGYYQVVYDVTDSAEPGFEPDFGYSVYVEFDGARLLLDTGTRPSTLLHNLAAAGIKLSNLDLVVISHNHPDHSGGLARLIELRPDLRVLAPPAQRLPVESVERVEQVVQITPNLFVVRTATDQPTVGISDELSVVAKTADGPYLLTACTHTGTATVLDAARRVAGAEVSHYTGGARLKFRHADDSVALAGELRRRRVAHVSPGHCSVSHAVAQVLQEELGETYAASRLGAKVALRTHQP